MRELLMTVFASFSLTVCAGSFAAQTSGAELVQSDLHGGSIRLRGAQVPALADARKLMAQHCGGGFEHEVSGAMVEFECASRPALEQCEELAMHVANETR